MNKEEKIKQWFINNKNYINTILSCENNYKFNYKEKHKGLNIKRDYEFLCFNINHIIKYYTTTNFMFHTMYNMIIWLCLLYVNIITNFKQESILDYLENIIIKKNRDYGSSFDKSVNKFGWIYVAIELDKKKNRLHSLLKNKEKPNYESIEDTLLDIAGYCVLSLIYLQNKEDINE